MVSLLELFLKDGYWTKNIYLQLDWDCVPKGYKGLKKGNGWEGQRPGTWYCSPPELYRYIAKTRRGLFILRWYSDDKPQFFRTTSYEIACYDYYHSYPKEPAFVIADPPSPKNWSAKEGAAFVWYPRDPAFRADVKGTDAVSWERLRP